MTNRADLRRIALEIFHTGLRAADPGRAVRSAVSIEGACLRILDTSFIFSTPREKIYVIAIGKASFPMACALDDILGDRLAAGVISGYLPQAEETHAQNGLKPDRWQVFAGGHPAPNDLSLLAARRAIDLLDHANLQRATIIFLISGGGSSMMEWPREGISLKELRTAYQSLVSCGAGIEEINSVRGSISKVKGGGLARRAPNSKQISLIISDTNWGHESTVASGPTFEHQRPSPDPRVVVSRYELAASLPESVIRAIDNHAENIENTRRTALRKHYVILDNNGALRSAAEAARSRGFITTVASDIVEQPIAKGCAELFSRFSELRGKSSAGCCVISGGEFACPVKGRGVGGRNTETVLRLAIEMSKAARQSPGETSFSQSVALSAGTDGIDGNSPAAGALADENTVARALAIGLDPNVYLESSDSYNFFRALDDAVVTGPTFTNVRDIRILL